MRSYDYNFLVIGGGPAGIAAARAATALGAKVALVERAKLGGDCLHTGCIPSKALLRTARFLAQSRRADALGLKSPAVDFDFTEVMTRLRRVIGDRAESDSAERLLSVGIAHFEGSARLLSRHEVQVNDRLLRVGSILLATGAHPSIPPIPGLESMEPRTSDKIWDLESLPRRLLVLGGGVIGCELAQAFARLGSAVTLVERNPRVLPREDEEVSLALQESLGSDGVKFYLSTQAQSFRRDGDRKLLRCEPGEDDIEFDEVLVALGRRPNTEGLGLEKAGVRLRANGTIEVDAYMRTSAPGIFACGDVAGPLQFAHFASLAGEAAARGALLAPAKRKVDLSVFPWAVYTDPEVARVGMDETEAKASGKSYEVFRADFRDSDRAVVEEEAKGFVKVLKGSGGTILGATIVGPSAGELIHEWALAMSAGLPIQAVASLTHAYPTLSEINREVALSAAEGEKKASALSQAWFRLRRNLGF